MISQALICVCMYVCMHESNINAIFNYYIIIVEVILSVFTIRGIPSSPTGPAISPMAPSHPPRAAGITTVARVERGALSSGVLLLDIKMGCSIRGTITSRVTFCQT